MATHEYKCNKCDFVEEYNNSNHVPKCMQVPEGNKCPKCEDGILEQQFSSSTHQGFDCIGIGFYINDYGKKAWKRNLTPDQQAKVLQGKMNPY